MAYTSDKRLYLDAAGNVVSDGDPAATELLVAAGGALPDKVAARHGLTGKAAKAQEPAEDKAVAGPKAKKASK